MKRLLFLCMLGLSVIAQAKVVEYTADDTTIFLNPERGFTNQYSRQVSAKYPSVLQNSWSPNSKMSIVMVIFNFHNFKAEDLPEEVLQGFDQDMQTLRENGRKCVLRFAYTESEKDNVDATPDWVERHLQQLKPYLHKNADVIYVLEAGFVGVWGEWYYTKNYGNESQHMNDNRRRVVDALLSNTPDDMFICFRYPMLKNEYLGDKNALTAEEAYTRSARARMAHHNDAFLNTWGDMGTYASDGNSDDPKMRQFIATESFFLPNGGECNIEERSTADKRATYMKTLEALHTYHWSFCGIGYPRATITKWREEGTLDEMHRILGYRYQLRETNISDQAAPGGKCNVTMLIRNTGCAPIYHKRTAYLVLKEAENVYKLPLLSDPRKWLPWNVTSAVNEQVDIPDNIPSGKYNLYLYLPDAHANIADNPRFAIRFANEDVWEESTGMNDLHTTITISEEAPLDPGELPEVTAVENISSLLSKHSAQAYDLLGRPVSEGHKGITIIGGKKIYIQ